MMKLARKMFWFPFKLCCKLCCFAVLLLFVFTPMAAWTHFLFSSFSPFSWYLESWQKLAFIIAGNWIWLSLVIWSLRLQVERECKNADPGS